MNFLFEGKLIQREDPHQHFLEFQQKKIDKFQNIQLIFNSIFYGESKEFTFIRKSRKKFLFEPSVLKEFDTKGGPLSTLLKILTVKKMLILKKSNSFLVVYFIKIPKSLF